MKIDGIEVVDSKSDLTLHITKNYVTQSLKASGQKDGWGCAAQCCALDMPNVEGAMINLAVSYILRRQGKSLKWHRYWTSGPLKTEIISYDRSGDFEPGDYTLLAVPVSARAKRGTAHSLGAPVHGRPGHNRRKPHRVQGVRAHAMCGLRTKGHDMIHGRPQKKPTLKN